MLHQYISWNKKNEGNVWNGKLNFYSKFLHSKEISPNGQSVFAHEPKYEQKCLNVVPNKIIYKIWEK